MKTSFSNTLVLLLALTSNVFGAGYVIMDYPMESSASKVAELKGLSLNKLVSEKLSVDDYETVSSAEFAQLKKIDDKFFEQKFSVSSGNLVVSMEAPQNIISLMQDEFVTVAEGTGGMDIDAQKLVSELAKSSEDLSLKLNHDNLKLLTNKKDMNRQVINMNLGVDEENFGELSANEKDLIELTYLIKEIFPKKLMYESVFDEKTFAFFKLRINNDNMGKVVANAVISMIKQISDYGIETTLIATSERAANDVSRNVKRDSVFKSTQSTFKNQDECIFATNNCNTHGLCTENKVTNTWSCVCSSTFNKTSKSTTHWAGASCSKIDLSVEFNLMFWFTVVMLFAMVACVSLVFKLDSEPLPGILNAATSETFKN